MFKPLPKVWYSLFSIIWDTKPAHFWKRKSKYFVHQFSSIFVFFIYPNLWEKQKIIK